MTNRTKPRVLFIEDDPQQMDIFRLYFERNDIEVERSYDGPDGIEVAKGWNPDFIILDMRMEGMGGLEVVTKLKSCPETKDIAVIIYTNYDTKDILGDMLELGAEAVLEKTVIRPPELVRRVKERFESQHQPEEP